MAQTFAGYVDTWCQEAEARMMAVFRRAVELLVDELTFGRHNGGRVPWVTGNMVRSLAGELNGLVQTSSKDPPPAGDAGAKIALMNIGDVIHLGYQAIYARRVNYGFVGEDKAGNTYNQEGAHFVEYAAQMWPTMVQLAAEEIRAMAQV